MRPNGENLRGEEFVEAVDRAVQANHSNAEGSDLAIAPFGEIGVAPWLTNQFFESNNDTVRGNPRLEKRKYPSHHSLS